MEQVIGNPGHQQSAADPNVYAEGLAAGAIGAATVAFWFLILDTLAGRPFHTPSVLGTALFGRLQGESPASFEVILVFTWVHLLVFGVIGCIASRLLAWAERDPDLGFGLVLLFVIFEFGFVAVAMVFAEPVLHALTIPAILLGNLLAAAAMAIYLRRRHPRFAMRP